MLIRMILAHADDVEQRWEAHAQNPKRLSSEVSSYSIDVSKELLKRMCQLKQSWSERVKIDFFGGLSFGPVGVQNAILNQDPE